MNKKISEISIKKETKKRYRDINEKLVSEPKEYYVMFTSSANDWLRILSKFIDFLLYFLLSTLIVFIFSNSEEDFLMHNIDKIIPISAVMLIAVNAILETLFGTMPGKYIFKFRVVNDYCKKPAFFLSLYRNFLSLANIPLMIKNNPTTFNEHNKDCKTYTITRNDLKQIQVYFEINQ